MVPTIWLKSKGILGSLLLPATIALVAIGAFGLGRLSALQSQKPHLIIHYPDGSASSTVQ